MWTLECAWTEIDLNESEINLNECEHFLKANLERFEIDSTWINFSANGSFINLNVESNSSY